MLSKGGTFIFSFALDQKNQEDHKCEHTLRGTKAKLFCPFHVKH